MKNNIIPFPKTPPPSDDFSEAEKRIKAALERINALFEELKRQTGEDSCSPR